MGYKLASALATGLSFIALDYFGFNPMSAGGDGTAGSGGNILALSLIYGLSPIGFKLAAIALVWNFPIDEARQQELVGQIHQGTS
jgi:Na+/melibiose symporter-like transporter